MRATLVILRPLLSSILLHKAVSTRLYAILVAFTTASAIAMAAVPATLAFVLAYSAPLMLISVLGELARLDFNLVKRLLRQFEVYYVFFNICVHVTSGFILQRITLTHKSLSPNDYAISLYSIGTNFFLFLIVYTYSIVIDVSHRSKFLRLMICIFLLINDVRLLFREIYEGVLLHNDPVYETTYDRNYVVCHLWCGPLYQLVISSLVTITVFNVKYLLSLVLNPRALYVLKVPVKRQFMFTREETLRQLEEAYARAREDQMRRMEIARGQSTVETSAT